MTIKIEHLHADYISDVKELDGYWTYDPIDNETIDAMFVGDYQVYSCREAHITVERGLKSLTLPVYGFYRIEIY